MVGEPPPLGVGVSPGALHCLRLLGAAQKDPFTWTNVEPFPRRAKDSRNLRILLTLGLIEVIRAPREGARWGIGDRMARLTRAGRELAAELVEASP